MKKTTKKKSKRFIALCEKYGVDHNVVPQILTVEAAFKAIGDNPKNIPGISKVRKIHKQAIVDQYRAWVVAEALNEGWVPDWTDHSQRKYTAYFYMQKDSKSSSGVGFSYGDYDGWFTITLVGSRLCFKNPDIAKFAAKHFLKLFRSAFLIE